MVRNFIVLTVLTISIFIFIIACNNDNTKEPINNIENKLSKKYVDTNKSIQQSESKSERIVAENTNLLKTNKNEDNKKIVNLKTSNYESVTIGNQIWMKRNLNVDHYRNGDPIPEVKDSQEWKNLKTGAWCYYNNDPANGEIYGKLYNWYAVNDSRGLAPKSWHIPTDDEWKELEIFIGMSLTEIDKSDEWRGNNEAELLKESGTTHWKNSNIGATNKYGFSALPGGFRFQHGIFGTIETCSVFWSSTEYGIYHWAWSRWLEHNSNQIKRRSFDEKNCGSSVRCIKDN